MKLVEISKIGGSLSKYVAAAKSAEIVIAENGRPVGYIHRFEDDDEAWEYALLNDPRFQRSVAKARKEMREGKFYTMEEVSEKLKQWEEQEEAKSRDGSIASEAPAHYGKATAMTRRNAKRK